MEKRKKTVRLIYTGIAIVLIAFVYAFTGCPIRFFLGICCPGCGMTRAVAAALSFRFHDAYRFHPMVFSLPIVVIFLFQFELNRISEKNFKIFAAVWLLLLLFTYFIRLFSESEIVFIDLRRGLFYRILSQK